MKYWWKIEQSAHSIPALFGNFTQRLFVFLHACEILSMSYNSGHLASQVNGFDTFLSRVSLSDSVNWPSESGGPY